MKKTVLMVAIAALACLTGCSNQQGQASVSARLIARVRAHMTSGRSELQRSFEAKKNATSFRMKTVLKLHPGRAMETLTEVSCPNRERITSTIGDKSFKAVRLGSQAFIEQADGQWTTQVTDVDKWSPCGDRPGEPSPWAMMNEGRDVLTVLAKLSSNAIVERGQYVITSNGACQEWLVQLQIPAGGKAGQGHQGRGMSYNVCLDPQKHLPVQVVMGGGGMVINYYDWNRPIQIEAPTT
jgi:hypothetical protein